MQSILVFDLDGTLIDSAPDLRTATNKVLVSKGRRPITMEETKRFVGNGAAKLIQRAFEATGEELKQSEIDEMTDLFLAAYDGHEADETQPYEDVIDTLEILKDKGVRMALCTNKPQVPTDNLLRDLNMDKYFEVVLGGDQLDRKKPDPQMLHWVLKKMSCSVGDAIMIGDSPNDIDAARNAGMRNIAVSYGYRRVSIEALKADIVIDQFKQIINVIYK